MSADSLVTFTFADVNPITERTYARSTFAELPGYAADVVTGTLALEPGEWDILVADDEAFDFTGATDSYPIPGATRRPFAHAPGFYVVVPPELMAPREVPEDTIGVIG
ncbi:hypothetical protein QRX60_11470 [Amycolatopsis mongoliensis]|uniref:Uncharacterized protein n=1 Tax=Amycolatopsis mongoliensis TaxID=715475 RepID=A0A9Y2NG47_9PSEU|nr:hypothetical protein [Amycolatopsis sp. 4-36]WIY04426.1 hypothetical protein QRX60_11470 [Amycolatopsis sp. 4-36]